MTTTQPPPFDAPHVYRCPKPIGWYAAGFIVGGVVFLFLLLIVFVLKVASLKPASMIGGV